MTPSTFARFALLMLIAFSFATIPQSAQDKFKADCPPPFEDPPNKRDVDKVCPNEGKFVDNDTPEHQAQNRAKNNLCATGVNGVVATDPIRLTVSTFDSLESSLPADLVFGNSANLPKNRDDLKNIATSVDGTDIGEGSYVVFVGFMLEAHPMGKESVSCQNGKIGFVDIHLSLASSKTAEMCKSITAEIIPHFRPQLWPRIYYKEHYEEIKAHPLRITGHLFFDGSHRPCVNGQKGKRDPARRSNWEIHPVYSIDVCSNKTIANCKFDNEAVWKPFAEWIESQ